MNKKFKNSNFFKEIIDQKNKDKELNEILSAYNFSTIYNQLAKLNNNKYSEEKKEEYYFLSDLLDDNITIRRDFENHPDSVFYFKGNKLLLELNKLNDEYCLFCNYYFIWNPLSTEYNLSHAEIEVLMIDYFKNVFNHKDLNLKISNEDLSKTYLLEKHFSKF